MERLRCPLKISLTSVFVGMYVMAAGQLTAVGTQTETAYSSIKVLKIADLSKNPCCEAMWLLEVLDAQL